MGSDWSSIATLQGDQKGKHEGGQIGGCGELKRRQSFTLEDLGGSMLEWLGL